MKLITGYMTANLYDLHTMLTDSSYSKKGMRYFDTVARFSQHVESDIKNCNNLSNKRGESCSIT